MPLSLLLILVIGGIAGIAILLHLTGHSGNLTFDDASARAHWQRHAPSASARAVHLSQDHRAALIETTAGLGLIWAMGADSTAHHLAQATATPTDDGLRLHLGDFAAPQVRVRLTPEDRARWIALIEDQGEAPTWAT